MKLAQLKADAKRAGWLDQVRTPNDERALLEGCWFDLREAQWRCDYFKRFLRQCENTIGARAGDPFELLEWQQRRVIYPLFGWKRPDGRRRIVKAYISTAKKQGKTTLMGGLGAMQTHADGEANAEVYIAAGDRKQAGICYRQARKLIRGSAALDRIFEPIDSSLTLRVRHDTSFLQALSAEAYTKEGLNWSTLIFDELHVQPDRRLWDTLVYGGSSRLQPLLIIITTSGNDQEGIGYEQYRYALSVESGEIEDTSTLCVVFEAPGDLDITDPVGHAAANPSLGITIAAETIAREALEAKAQPGGEARFRRYRLNQWVNVTGGWLPLDRWDATAEIEVDWKQFEGKGVFSGLDLSNKLDMTAFSMVVRHGDGIAVRPHYWVPQDRADELARKGNHSYLTWAKRGWLTLTPGGIIDFSAVLAFIFAQHRLYKLLSVGIDPYNASDVSNQLAAEGIPVVEIPQNVKRLSEPAKWFEALVVNRQVYHCGHPILRWNAGNTYVRYDVQDNILPQKPRKGSPRLIDGVSATIDAIAEMRRVELEQSAGQIGVSEFIEKFGGVFFIDE